MTATFINRPRFSLTQQVRFVGGEGIVRSNEPIAGTWTYLVEMPLGIEPDFSRVGPETKVFLNEANLRAAY
ncbi:hypothetical protein IFO70_19530 [Phormidium tenue FACHB-886]|nr:hypothetical protein [Phormidium tenue FACHB-886]